jgi:serine/threonine-protein kinase HipA
LIYNGYGFPGFNLQLGYRTILFAYRQPQSETSVDPPNDIQRIAMECGDQGRFANESNILSQHAQVLLEAEEERSIVNEMKEQIEKTWYSTVRACGVSENDAEAMRGAFVYPGFSRN